jgi:fructoselysine 6-kinase
VRLLTVGDNVVDRYPQRGEFYPGGNAVNVAVHARRLGAATGYLGALGMDRAGRVVLEALRAEGVDTRLVRVVDGPNAYAVVEVLAGNRVFSDGNLGVSVFDLTDEDLAAAAPYDVVHTGECSHIERQLPDLSRAARVLSFDFSERPWDYVEEYAPLAAVATWSAPGADLASAARAAERLRALGPTTVAVTLGARGAVVLQDRLTHRPPPTGNIVDTLGAGDAFIARLLVGLSAGESEGDLTAAATAYATASCSRFGAFGHGTHLSLLTTPQQPLHRPDRLDVS